MTCDYCHEEVAPDDRADIVNADFHRACLLRCVVGSVGHLRKRCSCYGGDEDDPPGLTSRQAALAAEKLYLRLVEGKQYLAA